MAKVPLSVKKGLFSFMAAILMTVSSFMVIYACDSGCPANVTAADGKVTCYLISVSCNPTCTSCTCTYGNCQATPEAD